MTQRAVTWVKDAPFGVEFVEINLESDRVAARGVAIANDPLPYRLDYTLETTAGFVTSRLHVASRGEGWRRVLELRRDVDGVWTVAAQEYGSADLPAAGGEPTALVAALDCDLRLSPTTNLMPVLRHGLLSGGGPVELTMAWVSVPDLSVQADGQRYAFVSRDHDRSTIRYEAADGGFAANITFDADGLVIDYPGIARRLEGA